MDPFCLACHLLLEDFALVYLMFTQIDLMKVICGLGPMLQVGFFFSELTCGKNKVVAREIRALKMSLRAFIVPTDPQFLLIFQKPDPFLCTFSTLSERAVGPAPPISCKAGGMGPGTPCCALIKLLL